MNYRKYNNPKELNCENTVKVKTEELSKLSYCSFERRVCVFYDVVVNS